MILRAIGKWGWIFLSNPSPCDKSLSLKERVAAEQSGEVLSLGMSARHFSRWLLP